MRTLRIYSLNNSHMQHRAVFIKLIMLYIIFLVLIYLITWSLYLLTTFKIPSLPTPIYGKHKFYLFLYKLFVFWSITDLQHYASSLYTT